MSALPIHCWTSSPDKVSTSSSLRPAASQAIPLVQPCGATTRSTLAQKEGKAQPAAWRVHWREGIEPSSRAPRNGKNTRGTIGPQLWGREIRSAVMAGSAGPRTRLPRGRSERILERQTNEEVPSVVAGGSLGGVQITDLEPGHDDRELGSAPDNHADPAVTVLFACRLVGETCVAYFNSARRPARSSGAVYMARSPPDLRGHCAGGRSQ